MIECVNDRVIASVDLEYKNKHTINDGCEIRLRRNVNEFDRRITEPVNAIVIHAKEIPKQAEILINHNATHDIHKLFYLDKLNGHSLSNTVEYFSIPIHDVYAWRLNSNWNPVFPYDLALRVFKPYIGLFNGILPTVEKQKLFMLTGKMKHKVVITRHHSDYEIIFQNEGKEERLIRVRTENQGYNKNQVYAIDHETTHNVVNGDYLIGTNISDCKLFNKQL